jgi:hypothetical protein
MATPCFCYVLLVLDAMLHRYLVYRFGAQQNIAFLLFALVYAALALAVLGLLGSFFSAVCAVLWVTLGLTAVGLIRLTITFNIVQHDKTLDRGIRAVDAIIIVLTVCFSLASRRDPPAKCCYSPASAAFWSSPQARASTGAQHEVGSGFAAARTAAGENFVQQRVRAFEHRGPYCARPPVVER